MTDSPQANLFVTPALTRQVEDFLHQLVGSRERPAPHELLESMDREIGLHARWDVVAVLRKLADGSELTREQRDYLRSIVESEDLTAALRGESSPRKEIVSSVDELLRQTQVYRSSDAFRELIQFMGRFRDYAPYNNMLVRMQNPRCDFYATARHWQTKFKRQVKEDARPMLILAPMHPVMLVYDLDQTEGPPLPESLENFARFEGEWDSSGLETLLENTRRYSIRVEFKALSSTHGGFAQARWDLEDFKRRIVIHDQLDTPSRFGILCHELAHILLGHLGGDIDNWWPPRAGIDRATAEIEAEAVAFIVTTRLGLTGSSASYVSGYLKTGAIPPSVSLDMVAKTSSLIERLATRVRPPPPKRKPKARGTTK